MILFAKVLGFCLFVCRLISQESPGLVTWTAAPVSSAARRSLSWSPLSPTPSSCACAWVSGALRGRGQAVPAVPTEHPWGLDSSEAGSQVGSYWLQFLRWLVHTAAYVYRLAKERSGESAGGSFFNKTKPFKVNSLLMVCQ